MTVFTIAVGCSKKAVVTAQSSQLMRLSSVIVAEEVGKGLSNTGWVAVVILWLCVWCRWGDCFEV